MVDSGSNRSTSTTTLDCLWLLPRFPYSFILLLAEMLAGLNGCRFPIGTRHWKSQTDRNPWEGSDLLRPCYLQVA